MNTHQLKKFKSFFTPTGFMFLFVVAASLIIMALLFESLFELDGFISEPWNILVALPFLWIGLFLIFWSGFIFFKVGGAVKPFNPPSLLVTYGPYTYSRNPMLTGVFLLSFGFGIIAKSIFLTLIFTPIFIVIMIQILKRTEEPELTKRFGESYLKYKTEVPMFMPKFSIPKISTLKIKFPKIPKFSFKFGKKADERPSDEK